MSDDIGGPDPARITTLADLARELDRLRRRAARPGQVKLSVRDVAARTGRAPSTLDPYLRGRRLCPADVYEEILRALEIPAAQLRPWLDAWDRLADAADAGDQRATTEPTHPGPGRGPVPLSHTERFLYRLSRPERAGCRVGIVTGDLRRIRCADVWVNPENTNMRMPRFEECSISAIIRYEGALRDAAGHVVRDSIAVELAEQVAGQTPVAPGTAIVTGPGELLHSNGVRHVVHVAAVHGEPGEGYRQIAGVGRCVINALAEVDRLNAAAPDHPAGPLDSVLFPLLGTGQGGADPEPTATALLGATLDYLTAVPASGRTVGTVYFLAYTDLELDLLLRGFGTTSQLVRDEPA